MGYFGKYRLLWKGWFILGRICYFPEVLGSLGKIGFFGKDGLHWERWVTLRWMCYFGKDRLLLEGLKIWGGLDIFGRIEHLGKMDYFGKDRFLSERLVSL